MYAATAVKSEAFPSQIIRVSSPPSASLTGHGL
jgi:hypothetical protein